MFQPLVQTSFLQNIMSSVFKTIQSSIFAPAPINTPPAPTTSPQNGYAVIGNRVWLDANKDGMQDANESGIANVTVKLLSLFGGQVAETTTDAQGYYQFQNVSSAIYRVQFMTPAGYQYTQRDIGLDSVDSDADSNGYTSSMFVFSGQAYTNFDAGMFPISPSATIGDRVWLDNNGNGMQEVGEPAFAGVTVKLKRTDAQSAEIITNTDMNGSYKFDNLAAGSYNVTFVAPAGYEFTLANQNNDDRLDSDADRTTGATGIFTISDAQHLSTVDAGLIRVSTTPPPTPTQKAAIGDYVWLDANNNGQQDFGEQGIAGVDVILNRTDIVYIQAPPEVRTKTDAKGYYKFDNLEAGSYSVVFVAPTNYAFTKQDIGNDNTDSDADPATGATAIFKLADGQQFTRADAGLTSKLSSQLASIGNRVWNDVNSNGVQDANESGLGGVSVRLLDANGVLLKTTISDTQGNYSFDQLSAGSYRVMFVTPFNYSFTSQDQVNDSLDSDANPSSGQTDLITLAAGEQNTSIDAGLKYHSPVQFWGSIGDKVWQDLNANGKQDANEPGLAGVKVHLYNASSWMMSETVSDANGAYKFDNMLPGSYRLHFVTPKGYMASSKDVGLDSEDSDVGTDGYTALYTLKNGEINNTVDAGFVKDTVVRLSSSVGNRVWLDSNQNGLQDVNEGGLSGVSISLYSKTDSNSIWQTPVATTKTDANGNYGFYDLLPGSYRIKVDFVPLYKFTSKDTGSNDAIDSDVDLSGYSDYFDLIAGNNIETIDVGMSSLFNMALNQILPKATDLLSNDSSVDSLLGAGSTPLVNSVPSFSLPSIDSLTKMAGLYVQSELLI